MIDKQKEYLDILTKDYLSLFFSFAMKRMNNLHEAEEFAQETMYQCIFAINKAKIIHDFQAFVWSIAHNTYKRWCARKKYVSLDAEDTFNTFSNIASDDISIEEECMIQEDYGRIHLELSRLSNLYRNTLIYFYYEELSIAEIGEKLNLSIEMVKFYLQNGRKKLKEAYNMENIGTKSFNPSEFSVYKSAIDFSNVNVWEVFKRKLPCQIALICHDNDKSISEISLETGVPAVYIEEEITFLMDAGVMISPVRNKYRTNLFILKRNAVAQVKEQFNILYSKYSKSVTSTFDKYLPRLKECDIFKQDVSEHRYAWFFADNVVQFDHRNHYLANEDYPQILSCGSKGFIFAEESKGSPWATGQTPTKLSSCTVWPRDITIFGEFHCQSELRDVRKAQALYDVYIGSTNEEDLEIYAQLIEEGYVVKKDGKLFCNIALSTKKSRKLFEEINHELLDILSPLCKEIRENIEKIVKSTIPSQLRSYAKGFTETWIMFYSGVYLYESLYHKGFLTLPEQEDKTPIACYIYED